MITVSKLVLYRLAWMLKKTCLRHRFSALAVSTVLILVLLFQAFNRHQEQREDDGVTVFSWTLETSKLLQMLREPFIRDRNRSDFRGITSKRTIAVQRRDGVFRTQPSAVGSHENLPASMLRLMHENGGDCGSAANKSEPADDECKRPPRADEIAMSNGQFQVVRGTFGTVHIRSCHLDYREEGGPVARCVVFLHVTEDFYEKHDVLNKVYSGRAPLDLVAQYWAEDGTLVAQYPLLSVHARVWKLVGPKGNLAILNFACYTKPFNVVAMSVRQTMDREGPTNLIQLRHQLPMEPVKDFVVCLVGTFLPFNDQSLRLIEWFEMLKILGAQSIAIYPFASSHHPNVTKVLRYYEKLGLVDLRPSSWMGVQSWPVGVTQAAFLTPMLTPVWSLREENIVINAQSCILDSIGKFKYAIYLDWDEVLMPKGPGMRNWHDMLQGSFSRAHHRERFAAMCYRERQMVATSDPWRLHKAAHPADEMSQMSPQRDYLLTHVFSIRGERNVPAEWRRQKCIFNLDEVVSVGQHGTHACVGNDQLALGSCESTRQFVAPLRVGRSLHYRTDCADVPSREFGVLNYPCREGDLKRYLFHEDRSVWRYKDELRTAMNTSMFRLGLL